MGRKPIDLTGQTFGKLTVLYRDMDAKSGAGYHVKWICRCECGNITSVESSKLKKGLISSCSNACNKSIPIGTKFNRLTVLEMTEKRTPKSHGGHVIYKCKCDCGNIIEVASGNLKDGRVKSCGCLSSLGEAAIQKLLDEHNIIYNTEVCMPDLISERGGRLRFDFYVNNEYVIEFDGEQHFMTTPKGHFTEEELKIIKERDNEKNQYCINKNIPMIRIPYTHLKNLCIEDLLLETSSFLI